MLLVLVRCAGKREVEQLGPIDLPAMLVLSETVSPALTAQDTSLAAGMVAAATLLVLSALVGNLAQALRRESLEALDDVKRAVVEPNGSITVVEKSRQP